MGSVLVATWKRSMPRAQRLKVVTPKEQTWAETGGGQCGQAGASAAEVQRRAEGP